MVKEIHIYSDCDDGHLVNSVIMYATHASIKIGKKVNISLNDDAVIGIPPGNYDLLFIETDCGDFKIDLPECYFDKIKLKSDCGDMKVNTNYNNISFDTDCGEYENNNLGNKKTHTKNIPNLVRKKVKSIVSSISDSFNKTKDRYF